MILTMPGKILDAHTMAASFMSDPVAVGTKDRVSIEIYSSATGDRVGTFGVEVSISGDNWAKIPNLSMVSDSGTVGPWTTVASTEFKLIAEFEEVSVNYVRLYYTRSSGSTGTCDAYINIK